MQGISIWYECIGRHLAPDCEPDASTKVGVMTRMLRGTGLNTLGAGIDAYYIASPKKSYLIGKVEMPNLPELEFIPSEEVSGEKFIAQWLVKEAPDDQPWMIGVIGNASPNASMKASHPLALCCFCGASSGFDFDLGIVRQAVAIIGEMDWKKEIAPALHTFQSRQLASSIGDDGKVERENLKLLKAFEKTPGLKAALLDLCRLPLKTGSGEYEILSWYNRVR